MDIEVLSNTAKMMVAPGKGILAMDESTPTCTKRFSQLSIDSTEDSRRAYREMLISTPGLSDFVSGAILYDETIRQKTSGENLFPVFMKDKGILPGIKVDAGARDLAGFPPEKITEGLDNLGSRLEEYAKMGARFAKWRAVITIGDNIPSRTCIEANAHALARYAKLCQESNIVPIVEPEVLIDGNHSIERCYKVTSNTLHEVFSELYRFEVAFEGMILKASMVISGKDASSRSTPVEVAEFTTSCLLNTVPASVAGVAFLSGGQTNEQATENLNAMNSEYHDLPWPLTFSYARALQQPAMQIWGGKEENVASAQKALLHRAKLNSAAATGQYSPKMEKEAA